MRLNNQELQTMPREIELPAFRREQVVQNTMERPTWLHFGPGNIFRAFIASLQQSLLNQGLTDTGIIAVAPNSSEIMDKIYHPHDNLSLLVTMLPDQSVKQKVIGSVTEGLSAVPGTADWQRLQSILQAETLQILSFTITEKGYKTKGMDGAWLPAVAADLAAGPQEPMQSLPGKVTSLLYARFAGGQKPLTLLSLDNCSKNGLVLQTMVAEVAEAWRMKALVSQDFCAYLQQKITYPCTMIDKITPRPSERVRDLLLKEGFADMDFVKSGRGGWYASFVNAEKTEYLVVEDRFANGRPPLENAGVIFTDAKTVEKVERMKVCTCLNPLHTALAVFGCLLGYQSIAAEMKDPLLKRLVERLGYEEGMKVVTNPGVLDPKQFIDECIEVRFPNPAIPDTPQRIACDTSQKMGIRLGETIKSYAVSDTLQAKDLKILPLVIAGWCRYLLGVDDKGETFTVSPDPMAAELQQQLAKIEVGQPVEDLHGTLQPILTNRSIWRSDLYEVGLGEKIEGYFSELLQSKGAVRKSLEKYVGEE